MRDEEGWGYSIAKSKIIVILASWQNLHMYCTTPPGNQSVLRTSRLRSAQAALKLETSLKWDLDRTSLAKINSVDCQDNPMDGRPLRLSFNSQ